MRNVVVHNEVTSHAFYRFLDEIDECLEHRILMPALAMSLALPDICGKIEYPKAQVTKFYYSAWYDKYQGYFDVPVQEDFDVFAKHDAYLKYLDEQYLALCNLSKRIEQVKHVNRISFWPKYSGLDFSGLSGVVVYALRCGFLHSGDASIRQEGPQHVFDFVEGTIMSNDGSSCMEIVEVLDSGKMLWHLNVDRICKCLVRNALAYFLEDIHRFDKVQFDVMSCSARCAEISCSGRRGMVQHMWPRFEEDCDV